MGESGVLLHSYSFAAPLSRSDSHEDNTNHALSQSVSFGRFVTENLEWGKWSSFSHKKYVDEAEKFSQPGSVAQKKAFFEAHYKRIAEAKKAASDDSLSLPQQQQPDCVAGLLNTLDTLTKVDEVKEEESVVLSIENDQQPERACVVTELEQQQAAAVVVVVDDFEEKEKTESEELLKKSGSVREKQEERISLTKNSSVVLESSVEKSETPEKAVEVVISQKISETPKKIKKPVRPRFSFFKFLMGNTKTQDESSTRKKRKKPFLCLCFQPEMVGETEAPTKTKTQRSSF